VIELTINSRRAEVMLSRMGSRAADLRPLWPAVQEALASMAARQFRAGGPPSHPWAPLSEMTLAMRREGPFPGNARILVDTGGLQESWMGGAQSVIRPSRDSLAYGSRYTGPGGEAIASKHQYGGVSRRGAWVPKRAIEVTEPVARHIGALVERFVANGRA